jgi:aminoglycoside phosphotransferase (APT) family kinase protein
VPDCRCPTATSLIAVDFAGLRPLAGGWSGQTFLAEAGGERSVVRIYAQPGPRGDAAPEVDAALLRLVRGLVPVADVLEVRRPQGEEPGLLVTSYVDGVRGDELLPTLDRDRRVAAGSALGTLLADLAGMPFLSAGWFADAELTVRPFGDLGLPDGLPDFLDSLELRVPPNELRSLSSRCADAQALLDTVGRVCLVHSDLNPKNLILDPADGSVRALLDWEFAHAGHPFTDLGNLLRFERDQVFADAVLGAYVDRRGGRVDQALALADAADLWALLELASRAGENPVADRALAKVRTLT